MTSQRLESAVMVALPHVREDVLMLGESHGGIQCLRPPGQGLPHPMGVRAQRLHHRPEIAVLRMAEQHFVEGPVAPEVLLQQLEILCNIAIAYRQVLSNCAMNRLKIRTPLLPSC